MLTSYLDRVCICVAGPGIQAALQTVAAPVGA